MKSKVAILLFLVLLVVSIVPASTVFYVFNDMISSQETIYKNKNINSILSEYESTLKKLSRLDPENEHQYKDSFLKIQDQKLIYGADSFFSDLVKKTLTSSFLMYLEISLATSLFFGFALSFYIHRIYLKMFNSLEKEKEKERSRYLNEIAKWQDVAKTLAYEVKKPLTPIRVWLSNLSNIDNSKIPADSNRLIKEAIASIEIEVKSLSLLMDNFKEFSILPKPSFMQVDFNSFIEEFVLNFKNLWENITFCDYQKIEAVFVNIDLKLMRNAIINLIDNASEANQGSIITFTITASVSENILQVEFFNTGNVILKENQMKIFEINYSIKDQSKNMGLGLAIVKTTILEHGGDIQCLPEDKGARFLISLPIYKESEKNV
jgi:signal transduction histidine kinase